jgi:hypothetical protein
MPLVAWLLLSIWLAFVAGPAASAVTIRRLSHGQIQPQALRDASGRIHLLYFSGPPAGGDLYYVTSDDDGGTFSPPVRVNSQPGTAIATGTVRGGQLTLGAGGRPHVSWNDAQGKQVFYSRMDAAGRGFEPQRGLMRRSLNLDGGGAIAADGRGGVFVAWHGNDARTSARDEASRTVWIATSHDDGATFGEEHVAWNQPTGACGCCGLALIAEPGRLSLLYRSATALVDRDIYLLSSPDDGGTFRGSRLDRWPINACPLTTMSFARTATGLLGAWETEGRVVVARLDAVKDTMISEVRPTVAKVPAKHPRIAVNARGESMLVWTEGTGWSRGGGIAWQLFDPAGRPTSAVATAAGVPVWSFAAIVPRRDGGFVIFY